MTETQPKNDEHHKVRRGLSLRSKTLLLVTGVTLLPLAGAIPLFVSVNRSAVERSEKALQTAVLSEVASGVRALLNESRSDASAVAAAFAEAALRNNPEGDGLSGPRAVLASRTAIHAVRFEVPKAKVSTILRRTPKEKETPIEDVPSSTDVMRQEADRSGVSFSMRNAQQGVLTVAIDLGKNSQGTQGYVTVAVDMSKVQPFIERAATTRFGEERPNLVLVDQSRKAIAVFGLPNNFVGQDVSKLSVWNFMPSTSTQMQSVSTVHEHLENGRPMIGAIETLPELGWALALWRPREIAYASLTKLRNQAFIVSGGALVLAIILGLIASSTLSSPIVRLGRQARLIGQRKWREVDVRSTRGDEIGQLAATLGTMASELEHSELEIERQTKLRTDLSRFLSKELADAIVRGEHALTLGGKRAMITVLFADVVAFTPLSESREPEQVVALLNELFSMLSEIVFRQGGVVDKFIGDCLMAVWGAPIAHEDHASRALAAAEDMLRFLETANEQWKHKYGIELRLGIGVNTGEVIVGNIGSDKRMEYTVIGDTVNIAARLESIAAPNQVLCTQNTKDMAGDAFDFDAIGERKLTGRATQTKVYALLTA